MDAAISVFRPEQCAVHDERLKEIESKVDDHEERMRELEKARWKAAGFVGLISGVASAAGALAAGLLR